MGHDSPWYHQKLNQTISKLHRSIHHTYNLSQNQIIEHTNQIAVHINSSQSTEHAEPTDDPTLTDTNDDQIPNPLLGYLSSALRSPWLVDHNQLATNLTQNTSYVNKLNYDDDSPILSDYWMLLLIVLYVIIILGGVFGNASLIVTLYTQSSAHIRNPLLVALCLADLMVSGISAPITVITVILIAKRIFSSTTFICRLICFVQVSIKCIVEYIF